MITITNDAVDQIRDSLKSEDDEELKLRVAATRAPDGSFEYAMGIIIETNDNDISMDINGIPVVVDEPNRTLIEGMVIDYVELEEGQPKSFIFLNPNDPNYIPPTDGTLENVPAKNQG